MTDNHDRHDVLPSIDLDEGIDQATIGAKIDRLIRADLKNWEGKELFFDPATSVQRGNTAVFESFLANKVRNLMITEINHEVHQAPAYHFRNYHNY